MIHEVNTKKSTARSALMCGLGLIVLTGAMGTMGGCRGDRTDKPPRQFFPDLDDQPKIKAQSETEFFANGSSQRLPVEGVVAFGSNSVLGEGHDQWVEMFNKDRDDMLRDDETYYFGLVKGSNLESPDWVSDMPVEVTEELIERGGERYNIYCSMCHGYDALGNDSGTVGRLMNVRPVNLLQDKYRDRTGEFGSDGYLFHIIREGLWSPDGGNRMPAYGHAVDEQDAWAIVAYIRTLQAAFDTDGNKITQAHEQGPETITSSTPDSKLSKQIDNPNNGGEG